MQHRNGIGSKFTSKYKTTDLVYFEEFIDININFQKPYYYVITAFDEVPNESGSSEIILGPFPPEINNQITDLSPLSGLTSTWGICLADDQISDLSPLSGLSHLLFLDVSGNQVSDLSPLSQLTNIRWLHLDSNQISELSPLSELASLAVIDLANNQIPVLGTLSEFAHSTRPTPYGNQTTPLAP